ncbi:hypothetical protein [Methanolapillus millepedarum]|uniref:Uncharacterized protein n=1 Tax=Methanolapillus millepedarum TaxID=3028296 RepID=A0AA97A4X9_9EURY|nr:hypothetical protein MsAc7_17260 [Methanosarcinaceae archaeon Ac7]
MICKDDVHALFEYLESKEPNRSGIKAVTEKEFCEKFNKNKYDVPAAFNGTVVNYPSAYIAHGGESIGCILCINVNANEQTNRVSANELISFNELRRKTFLAEGRAEPTAYGCKYVLIKNIASALCISEEKAKEFIKKEAGGHILGHFVAHEGEVFVIGGEFFD